MQLTYRFSAFTDHIIDGLHSYKLVFLTIIFVTMTACDWPDRQQDDQSVYLQTEEQSEYLENGGVLNIASGISLTTQRVDLIEYKLSAKTVLVKPRSFGGLSILDVNELYLHDAHIEIFPTEGDNAKGQPRRDLIKDISDVLTRHADRISEIYGNLSRIYIKNVRITMIEAGKEGSNIVITADKLTQDHDGDSLPKLYNVTFSEEGSNATLVASQANWNLEQMQFVLK